MFCGTQVASSVKKPTLSIFLLVLIVVAIVSHAFAGSRVNQPTATLLWLYSHSDSIVVARYDRTEEIGQNRYADEYSIVATRSVFDVERILKGKSLDAVNLSDNEFRYAVLPEKGEPHESKFVDGFGGSNLRNTLRTGETVILFLKLYGDEISLTDYNDGIKKLSESDLMLYVDRIVELNSIFDSEQPDGQQLNAWLVRCAEQRATRWDGTHELLQRTRKFVLEGENENTERLDPMTLSTPAARPSEQLALDQIWMLTNIFLSREFRVAASEKDSGDILPGDRELIELVRRLNVETTSNYLTAQIAGGGLPAIETVQAMKKVSDLLQDRRLSLLTQRYSKETQAVVPDVKLSGLLLKAFVSINDEVLATRRQSGN
jgi:hypothetical protein